MGGLTDDNLVEVNHRLLFGFLCAHTTHLAILGADLIELASFGLMPSGIWYTGLINSIMRSLGVILAGAIRAISVGDDNVRGPPRPHLTEEDLAHLWKALLKTGLIVKDGTQRSSAKGGPYEITSHSVWVRADGTMGATYLNEEKFLASFLLKTFPHEDEYNKASHNHPGSTVADLVRKTKIRPPTIEQTGAYKFFLRHSDNTRLRNFLADIYAAMGWSWDNVGIAENEHAIIDLL